jgi:hypothetical protein
MLRYTKSAQKNYTMSPDRRRPRVLERLIHRSPDKPIWMGSTQERNAAIDRFLKIEDIDTAKNEVLGLLENRLYSSANENGLKRRELRRRIRYSSNALDFAIEQHDGQKRIKEELPAILHPLGVAYMNLLNPDIEFNDLHTALAVGANHDVLEDTDTYPSDLGDVIGDDEAGYVLALSTKVRVFSKNPAALERELNRSSKRSDAFRTALSRWKDIDRTDRDGMLTAHRDWISELPNFVGITRANDRSYNLDTLPEQDGNYPPETQRKIARMLSRVFEETREYVLPLATGVALEILTERLIKAHKKHRQHNKPQQ